MRGVAWDSSFANKSKIIPNETINECDHDQPTPKNWDEPAVAINPSSITSLTSLPDPTSHRPHSLKDLNQRLLFR